MCHCYSCVTTLYLILVVHVHMYIALLQNLNGPVWRASGVVLVVTGFPACFCIIYCRDARPVHRALNRGFIL